MDDLITGTEIWSSTLWAFEQTTPLHKTLSCHTNMLNDDVTSDENNFVFSLSINILRPYALHSLPNYSSVWDRMPWFLVMVDRAY
jgi:hypothetical protein